jgi:hypothetical protein
LFSVPAGWTDVTPPAPRGDCGRPLPVHHRWPAGRR